MLVHEFDDEATLDEEEEIEPIDSQLLELQDLQRVCNKLQLTRSIVHINVTIIFIPEFFSTFLGKRYAA